MARCYQLSPEQSRDWNEGSWPSIALEDTIYEWCYAQNIKEPVVVMTHDHQIAFALTAQGVRA